MVPPIPPHTGEEDGMKNLMFAVLTLMLLGAPAAAQQFGPWQKPQNLGAVVNSTCNDMHPTLSKDGLSLLFSSNRPQDTTLTGCDGGAGGSGLHLWVAQRDSLDSPWQAPQPLTMINSPDSSPYQEHAPYLTTDGHWLFFHSTRPGDSASPSCNGGGYNELWAAHRQDKRNDFGWEPPINLGCTLNIPFADDAGPNVWEDDSTGTIYLYFTRKPVPYLGFDPAGDGFDIYVSICTADLSSCIRQQLWGAPELVTAFNSSVRDTRTAIRRRDGMEMIITSGRCNSPIPAADADVCTTVSRGGLDMWVTTRPYVDGTQAGWTAPPVDLNDDNLAKCAAAGIDALSCPIINVKANDGAPALSWDGQTMVFYSNRAGGSGGNDLYVTTRDKLPDPQ